MTTTAPFAADRAPHPTIEVRAYGSRARLWLASRAFGLIELLTGCTIIAELHDGTSGDPPTVDPHDVATMRQIAEDVATKHVAAERARAARERRYSIGRS